MRESPIDIISYMGGTCTQHMVVAHHMAVVERHLHRVWLREDGVMGGAGLGHNAQSATIVRDVAYI